MLPAMNDWIWVHDLSPFIFQIGDGFGLRWYGMAYLAGLVWGAWLAIRWAKQQRLPLEARQVPDFATWVGVGMILGGRLGYCTFYQPELWVTFDGGPPWWGVLKVWEGGMSSHGGIVGLAAGSVGYAWRMRVNPLVLGDCVAAVAPIGVMCGRLANFINGELWGKPTDGDWGVIFPAAERIPPEVVNVHAWLLEYGIPRYPNQLVALATEGLIPLLIALPIHKRHRKPGLTIGVVITAYAIGRFINEFWREPDVGVPLVLGMSRGQVLTLPLLAIGIGIAVWAWRRPAKPEAYDKRESDSAAEAQGS